MAKLVTSFHCLDRLQLSEVEVIVHGLDPKAEHTSVDIVGDVFHLDIEENAVAAAEDALMVYSMRNGLRVSFHKPQPSRDRNAVNTSDLIL